MDPLLILGSVNKNRKVDLLFGSFQGSRFGLKHEDPSETFRIFQFLGRSRTELKEFRQVL